MLAASTSTLSIGGSWLNAVDGLFFSSSGQVTFFTGSSSPVYSVDSTGNSFQNIVFGSSTPATSTAWYSASWLHRKLINITGSLVSGTQTNFPVLVSTVDPNLAYTGNGGHVGTSTGNDILFTAADGVTKLNHEIESYTSSTGALVAWVQVPQLTSTTSLYIYYGNAGASNQQNATSTWDPTFLGVWHLGDSASSATSIDSTGNGYSAKKQAVNNPAAISTGTIDGASSFNGSTSFASTSKPLNLNSTTTISAWVKRYTTGAIQLYFTKTDAHAGNSDYAVGFEGPGANVDKFQFWDSNLNPGTLYAARTITDTNWHQLVVVTDFHWYASFYVDGAFVNTGTYDGNNSQTIHSYPTHIGDAFGNAPDLYWMNGAVDELRVASSPRSAAWILTEFNNESSPGTFLTVKPEDSYPGGVWNITSDLNASGNLAVVTGTVVGSANVLIAGGNATSSGGTLSFAGGTFTLAHPGFYGGLQPWSLYNFIASSGASGITTTTGTGTTTVTGAFTIWPGSGFNAATSTFVLTAISGAPFVPQGTFLPATSTVLFTGDGNITIASTTYYNLTLSPTLTASRAYSLGGPGIIQFIQATSTVTTTTAASVTFPSPVGAGDTIIGSMIEPSGSTVQVGDTRGNSYTIAVGSFPDPLGDLIYMFYAPNVAGGPTTVIATSSLASPAFNELNITEYSGLNTVSSLDAISTGTSVGGGVNPTTATTTITSAKELIWAYGPDLGSGLSAGASFTPRLVTQGDTVEDKIVSTAGSYSAYMIATTTSNWAIVMGTFKTGPGSGIPGATTINNNFLINPTSSSALNLDVTLASTTTVLGGTTVMSGGSSTSTLDTTPSNSSLTTGNLTIQAGDGMNANGSNVTLTGINSPLVNNGLLSVGTSTFIYTGAGATVVNASTTYWNLTLQPVSSGAAFGYQMATGTPLTVSSTLNVNGSGDEGANWTQATSSAAWAGRKSEPALVYHGKLWLLGGQLSGPVATSSVWSSSDGVNWTFMGYAPWTARYSAAGLVYKDKMWIMGGTDQSAARKNDVWWSTDGVNWTQATSSATWAAREAPRAVVFKGYMWIVGGYIGSVTHDVYYSSSGIAWATATSSANWSIRYYNALVVKDGKMWVYGGYGGVDDCASGSRNDVWWSSDGVNWTQATASAPWACRWQLSYGVYDNKLWVVGGYDSSAGYRTDAWYSPDGVNWTMATSGTATKTNDTPLLAFQNRLWRIGGENGSYLNNVWYTPSSTLTVTLGATTTVASTTNVNAGILDATSLNYPLTTMNLAVGPGGTLTGRGSALLATGDVSINGYGRDNGGILQSTTNTLTIQGNYTQTGTFASGTTGTVLFNGSAQQVLAGEMTGGNAFGLLTFANNSGGDPSSTPSLIVSSSLDAATSTITTANVKVRWTAGATTTIFNGVNWNGQASTTRIAFRSSVSGTPWGLIVESTSSVFNVDTKDSNACGQATSSAPNTANSATTITAGNGTSLDSGGNYCWSFASSTQTQSITLTLDTNTLNLPSLTPGAPVKATTTATVSITNTGGSGYTLFFNRIATTSTLTALGSGGASSSGPFNTATVVNDVTTGTIAWTSPGNATTSDNVVASSGVFGVVESNYLKATNFGFSIPSTATVTGIKVEVRREDSNLNAYDASVRIVKGGTIQNAVDEASSTVWPVSMAYATYGSSTDLWGTTWAPSDINASNFGFVLACRGVSFGDTCWVDQIRITAYYTVPGYTGVATFPDYAAWAPTGTTCSPGEGNGTTTPNRAFSFRVQQSGTNSNYCTNWWGANDTLGTAIYAGTPTSTQTIMNCPTCNSGTTVTYILYQADAPATQPIASYTGQVTITALANP